MHIVHVIRYFIIKNNLLGSLKMVNTMLGPLVNILLLFVTCRLRRFTNGSLSISLENGKIKRSKDANNMRSQKYEQNNTPIIWLCKNRIQYDFFFSLGN